MLAIVLTLAFAGQTKLYSSGCASIDTLSAVVPIDEFRTIIQNNEERSLLRDGFSTCLDQAEAFKKQSLAWRATDSADSTSAAKYKAALDTSEKARDALKSDVRKAIALSYKDGFWDGVKRAAIVAVAVDAVAILGTAILVITHW